MPHQPPEPLDIARINAFDDPLFWLGGINAVVIAEREGRTSVGVAYRQIRDMMKRFQQYQRQREQRTKDLLLALRKQPAT